MKGTNCIPIVHEQLPISMGECFCMGTWTSWPKKGAPNPAALRGFGGAAWFSVFRVVTEN